MFVALKSGLAAKHLPSSGTTAKELCKILPQQNVNKIQVAGLTRAKYRDESEFPNIKPFPYHEKYYGWWQHLVGDSFIGGNRINKHTKLITVDGPVACGKEKFAKKLAEELDFLYVPQPTFDDLYVTHWGYDTRQLDKELPKSAQTWDIERFCQDPFDVHSAMMQNYMLYLRQKSYILCLLHIFCTGQGVVTVRSPWSGPVFDKAMYKNKYISKNALNVITDNTTASLYNYLKPHLIIYLDVPVDKTLENIQKHGKPFEKNAKAFTQKYLSDIEKGYKVDFLPHMDLFSLILCYDWTEGGDMEYILEDIEDIDFDQYANHQIKLSDWRLEYGIQRYYARLYSCNADTLLRNMDIMRFDCPEMLNSGEDFEAWDDALAKIPDSQYAPGYNAEKGDKNILFKTGQRIPLPDNVTPLMKKYEERKAREGAIRKSKAAVN